MDQKIDSKDSIVHQDIILEEVKETGHREILSTCPKRNNYDSNI